MADLPIGDLLSETWERFRASPGDFLVLAFLAAAVPIVVQTALLWPIDPSLAATYRSTGANGAAFGPATTLFSESFSQVPGAGPSPAPLGDLVLGAAISTATSTVLGALFGGALVGRALDDPARGGVGRSLKAALNRLVPLVVAGLVLGVLTLLLIAPGIGLMALGIPTNSMALVFGGLIAVFVGFIVAVYVLIATFIYQAAVLGEDRGGVEALRRSWELTRDRRLHIFVATLVLGILLALVALVVQLPFFVGQIGAAASGAPDPTAIAVSSVGAIVAGTVTGAFFPIMVVRIYRRLAGRDVDREADPSDAPPDEGYVPVGSDGPGDQS